jgi:hypothetical protein
MTATTAYKLACRQAVAESPEARPFKDCAGTKAALDAYLRSKGLRQAPFARRQVSSNRPVHL